MSREDDNKAIIGRWLAEFWGRNPNLIDGNTVEERGLDGCVTVLAQLGLSKATAVNGDA